MQHDNFSLQRSLYSKTLRCGAKPDCMARSDGRCPVFCGQISHTCRSGSCFNDVVHGTPEGVPGWRCTNQDGACFVWGQYGERTLFSSQGRVTTPCTTKVSPSFIGQPGEQARTVALVFLHSSLYAALLA